GWRRQRRGPRGLRPRGRGRSPVDGRRRLARAARGPRAARRRGPASLTPARVLPPVRISPSLLSADFVRLADDVRAVEAAGADWLHVDVMDGHFVPNLTVGIPVVAALKKVATKPLDVHIMITDPIEYAERYVRAGAA